METTVCWATETSYCLEIANIETTYIMLSSQRITKVLIRLRGCADLSAPFLFAYDKNRFSHDGAHICEAFFKFMLYVYGQLRVTLALLNGCTSLSVFIPRHTKSGGVLCYTF